jgi:methylenetetrahydrofolate reductase (NADPH)
MPANAERIFSFEFSPATAEGAKLAASARNCRLGPKFFSVTFGAGGSRDRTLVPCSNPGSGTTGRAASLHRLVPREHSHDTRHLPRQRHSSSGGAARDLPSGSAGAGEFRYANELVAYIRAETGDWFHIDVACYPEYHPQSTSPATDLASFKRKVDAGANSSITQYFFNPDSYYQFVDAAAAAGVTVPIVPGVMPITSFSKLARFSDACGAEIPRWIRRKMESFGDDASSVHAFGLDVLTDLCAGLLEHGAPGLHFYTLNQARPVIWQHSGCRTVKMGCARQLCRAQSSSSLMYVYNSGTRCGLAFGPLAEILRQALSGLFKPGRKDGSSRVVFSVRTGPPPF